MHGMGVHVWPDGKIYKGEYYKGKKHGYGVYTWANGREYSGSWKNGLQDGVGELRLHQKGEPRRGIWKEGKFVAWIDEDESTTAELIKEYCSSKNSSG